MSGARQASVGIIDVAKMAGVSVGTVSNYLNYPDRVSDTLRIKIQSSIDQLGYERKRPTKATGRTRMARTIGLVMADIEHSLYTSIFEGAQEVASNSGVQVIGMNSYSDKNQQLEAVRHLCQMRVAGILLSSVFDSSEEIALAEEASIPLVTLDHDNQNATAGCTVLENNRAAGEIAARELIAQGRRRLAFVGHSFESFQAIADRWSGASRYVETYGHGASIHRIDSRGLMVEDGQDLARALLARPESNRPNGIIAATDFLACGIINTFTEDGSASIPEDIAVIGMEGDRLDSICSMPLTVIQAPGDDMGRQAMTQLLDEIEHPASHVHSTIALNPALIRRSSC